MNTDYHLRRTCRPGFTLTELLVVMTIITILAGVVVAFLPRLQESQRAYKGADAVQGALFIAKQRALRDQRPTGIRMIPDPSSGFVTEVQYIQQPEDFTTGKLKSVRGSTAQFTGARFTGGLPPSLAPVQGGDYLEICGGGLPHQIAPKGVGANSLTVVSPFPSTLRQGAYAYRVMRQPRLLAGEPSVALPDQVGIDFQNSGTGPFGQPGLPNSWSGKPMIDILFSPAGGVIFGQGGIEQPQDLIVLWVRNFTYDATSGSPALIAIQCRTGFIAAHPVDVSGGDPYSFTKDNKSSGM